MQPKNSAVYVHMTDFNQALESTKHIQHRRAVLQWGLCSNLFLIWPHKVTCLYQSLSQFTSRVYNDTPENDPILIKQILIVGGKYWYNFTTLWTSKLLRTKNTGGAELQSMAVHALFDYVWPLQQKHCCQGHLSRITDWDGQLDWDFEFDCRVLSIFDSCYTANVSPIESAGNPRVAKCSL